MCVDMLCPSAKTCKRSAYSGTVPDMYMQSYTDFGRPQGMTECDKYWPKLNKNEYSSTEVKK